MGDDDSSLEDLASLYSHKAAAAAWEPKEPIMFKIAWPRKEVPVHGEPRFVSFRLAVKWLHNLEIFEWQNIVPPMC